MFKFFINFNFIRFYKEKLNKRKIILNFLKKSFFDKFQKYPSRPKKEGFNDENLLGMIQIIMMILFCNTEQCLNSTYRKLRFYPFSFSQLPIFF